MSMKMWSLFERQKILRLLKGIHDGELNLTLWQHSSQQVYQLTGKFKEVKEDKCQIEIENSELLNDLIKEEALYVHCQDIEIIFKREAFVWEKNVLQFKTPSELMVKEKRRIERFRFRYQDFKNVSLEYTDGMNNETLKDSFGLLDLSTAGLSFVGPTPQMKNFVIGQKVLISRITDQEIGELCEATIVSIGDFSVDLNSHDKEETKVDGHSLIRVGVEFQVAIESVSFKSVKSVVERTQKRTAGLEIEGFNGLKDSEQLRLIKKVGEDNAVLAAQLLERCEDLDRLKYLTAEMKVVFWKEVNQDLLATALRLSSKELIYDLLSEVSESMREEFLEKLNIPKSPSSIEKAQKAICEFIHKKEKKGSFVLSAQSFVKYV
jgi:hypothetical protein